MPTNSGPITNYKQLIEYFRTICGEHLAIEQFTSGRFEDIDVPTNTQSPIGYPLAFLIYDNGEINSNMVSFDFTLIIADISKDRETLEVNRLSQTHDILMDIISKFNLTLFDEVEARIQLPIITTPFIERFNNKLTGWAAEVTIELMSGLDLCNAGFE